MTVEETALEGVLLIELDRFGDDRGWFLESWRSERYAAEGLPDLSAQDNLSFSQHGVLRGLHLQSPRAQAKLCQVLRGEVFDVAVDVRPGSARFGHWVGVTLSGERTRQLFVPEGFAHGFCVLSPDALFAYKCSQPYDRDCQLTIRWDDPDLAIDWPIERPRLSVQDASAPRLAEIDPAGLPPHPGAGGR